MQQASQIQVYLITGFLGSGKTTFVNRIIKASPKDRKLMILMNEFGEIGIDGRLVEDQDLAMLEISKGSIFCVCVKTDFIKGLSKIAGSIRPDVLIIEATGVANPGDLKRDLQLSIFKDRFHFMEQFCIIDAENFVSVYETFTSVEKQIESSTVFVINKTDLATAEEIDSIRTIVERHHFQPQFFETTHADIPLERFLPVESQASSFQQDSANHISDEQLEAAIEALLDDPQRAATPPDILASSVYMWNGFDLQEFRQWANLLPARLVRAKGFLQQQDSLYLFSWVMGKWELKPVSLIKNCSDLVNKIVFIAHPQVLDKLALLAGNHPLLAHVSSFDPITAGRSSGEVKIAPIVE